MTTSALRCVMASCGLVSLACACVTLGAPATETSALAPAWLAAGSGAHEIGPLGEGFYAVGKVTTPASNDARRRGAYNEADRKALDALALVFDRFWNRALSRLTQETGTYGLFTTFEGAPCRLALATQPGHVIRRWSDSSGQNVAALAGMSRVAIERQLRECPGCQTHPVCTLITKELDVLFTDYAAWSESVSETADGRPIWITRGNGPSLDGPGGKGFYGVGSIESPTDPLFAVIDLQQRARTALMDALYLFVSHAIGTDAAPVSSSPGQHYNSIVPPCVTAVEQLVGNVIELYRRPSDGYATDALAFLPAMKVKAAIIECDGCDEINMCKSMYTYFDDLFLAAARSNNTGKLPRR
jgi:hypothetical protein